MFRETEGVKMNHTIAISDHSERLRQQTILTLEGLYEEASRLELPGPPEALGVYRSKLVENSCNVIVIGAAKRGKSTFVNALIGRDLLPTDVDIATSQAFYVRSADHEAYRLRFEDGSSQEIKAEDLAHYGKQVLEDHEIAPPLSQVIRSIEVEAPVRFLPKGTHLIDTPGLGSLFTAHTQITEYFVPQADAVIFVLDSGQAITRSDLDLIQAILDVTTNIFIVQTKIDLYGEDHWKEIQRRNQEILQGSFKDQKLDCRVWPVSSQNLLRAAQQTKYAAAYLKVSGYDTLGPALEAFLYRVAGLRWTTLAIGLAERYRSTSRQILLSRVAEVEGSEQEQIEVRKSEMERNGQFQADWDERGPQRAALMAAIERITRVKQQIFQLTLQPGGPVDLAQRERIKVVKSLREAEALCDSIPGEVIGEAMKKWRRIQQDAIKECVALLSPFSIAVDSLYNLSDTAASEPAIVDKANLTLGMSRWERIKAASEGALHAMEAVSVTGHLILIVTMIESPPLAILFAGVLGLFRGIQGGRAAELAEAKAKLNEHLTALLQKVWLSYTGVSDEAADRYSRVDEFFDKLKRNVLGYVQKSVNDSAAEMTRSNERARFSKERRITETSRVQHQLEEWDAVEQSIKAVGNELDALELLLAA